MITSEQALARIVDFSEAELRNAVVQAMFDGLTLVPAGIREAQPEDIFIGLLAGADTPQRRAVIDGCRVVCGRLLEFLNQPALIPDSAYEHAFAHFAALLAADQPPEFDRQVRSLLQLALDESVPKTVRNPIVRAAVAYARNEADAPYWLGHIEGDLIPGYAFQALLQIDPLDIRLERCLSSLWRRALRGELRLRGPLFAEEWLKHQVVPDTSLQRVLQGVIQGAPELRQKLIDDCVRYPHSATWVDLLSAEPVLSTISGKFARSEIKQHFVGNEAYQVISAGPVSRVQSKINPSQLNIHAFGDAIGEYLNIQQTISPHTFVGGAYHCVTILNTQSDADTDDIVATALKRCAMNLSTQIANPRLPERQFA